MSAETGVALARVCRLLAAPRSTIYARRGRSLAPSGATSDRVPRGPKPQVSDEPLLAMIRDVVRETPFAGEGHRKVTARLRREREVYVGRKRVLRLMRQAGLLVPQRARGRRKPRPHDGTIIPAAPDRLWGTDATIAYTRDDGKDLRTAVRAFVERYNTQWLIERHGHKTPREAYAIATQVTAA